MIASGITADWDFYELLVPQILRGVSLMMCMVPINNLALGTLPPDQLKNASGLYNLTRNLGGAVGLALINTVLNDRDGSAPRSGCTKACAWGRAVAEDTLAGLSQQLSAQIPDGDLAAVKQLSRLVRQQAEVLAFADVFIVLTGLFAGMALLALFMNKPADGVPASGH